MPLSAEPGEDSIGQVAAVFDKQNPHRLGCLATPRRFEKRILTPQRNDMAARRVSLMSGLRQSAVSEHVYHRHVGEELARTHTG